MSIFYNKVERENPMNPSAGKKWYAVLKTISQIEEKKGSSETDFRRNHPQPLASVAGRPQRTVGRLGDVPLDSQQQAERYQTGSKRR
ncbi:MAG: hypothetical protein LBG15_14655 [Dysgonamonadaceae bacterium]|nr:hypothetical protein [Dysgonamonadaceae bacterium]